MRKRSLKLLPCTLLALVACGTTPDGQTGGEMSAPPVTDPRDIFFAHKEAKTADLDLPPGKQIVTAIRPDKLGPTALVGAGHIISPVVIMSDGRPYGGKKSQITVNGTILAIATAHDGATAVLLDGPPQRQLALLEGDLTVAAGWPQNTTAQALGPAADGTGFVLAGPHSEHGGNGHWVQFTDTKLIPPLANKPSTARLRPQDCATQVRQVLGTAANEVLVFGRHKSHVTVNDPTRGSLALTTLTRNTDAFWWMSVHDEMTTTTSRDCGKPEPRAAVPGAVLPLADGLFVLSYQAETEPQMEAGIELSSVRKGQDNWPESTERLIPHSGEGLPDAPLPARSALAVGADNRHLLAAWTGADRRTIHYGTLAAEGGRWSYSRTLTIPAGGEVSYLAIIPLGCRSLIVASGVRQDGISSWGTAWSFVQPGLCQ